MNDEEKRNIALFRYGIIAPLISGTYDESKSRKEFFRNAAKRTYTNPRGNDVKFSNSTIERWYYDYKKGGFDALIPQKRADSGQPRKVDDDVIRQIRFLKEEYPKMPATIIHQKLIDNGTISKDGLSLSTINRHVNKLKIEKKFSNNKDMRRFERAHINEVWYGDTCYGPYLKVDGDRKSVV